MAVGDKKRVLMEGTTADEVGAINQIAVYYPPTAGKSADDLTDAFALISVSESLNSDLFKIVGGTFAYVQTLFYSNNTTADRRMQLAFSYNSSTPKAAFRIYGANGFLSWREMTDAEYVKNLISSLTAADVGAASLTGSNTFQKTVKVDSAYPAFELRSGDKPYMAQFSLGYKTAALNVFNDKANTVTYRELGLRNKSYMDDVADALVLQDVVDGNPTNYPILHTGNVGYYAAPAGFGYGEACKSIYISGDTDSSLTTAKIEEYYQGLANGRSMRIAIIDVAGLKDGHWFEGKMYRYSASEGTIELYATHGLAIKRYKGANGWQPWEWVNPPMQPGVEYRTTERYQGKPVYVKLVGLGGLPSPGSGKNVSACADADCVFDVKGTMQNSSERFVHNLPAFDDLGNLVCRVIATGNVLSLRAFTIDLSATYTAQAIIKYTKTTD